MTTEIREWSITDHGVEHDQYFQGHGIACTKWTHCATGVGASALEAAEDALDQLAASGFQIPAALDAEVSAMSDRADSLDDIEDEDEDEDASCEWWHRVSIDVL